MQTSMKRGTLSDQFVCILLSDFLISNDIFGGLLWVSLNKEISKSTVLLANEHQSDQKKT